MTKRLIINADDYGLARDINRGIMECYTRGAVTDMGMLAVGDSFWHAAKLAKKYNLTDREIRRTVQDDENQNELFTE